MTMISRYGISNYPAIARISGIDTSPTTFTPNVKYGLVSSRNFKPKINKLKLVLAKLIEVLKK